MFSRGKRWQVRRAATSSSPLPKLALVSAVAAIVVVGSTACGPRDSKAEAEGQLVATAYLRAWEAEDFEAMCVFAKSCEQSTTVWLETMRSFPVHVRFPEITSVKATHGGVVVRYSLEMPDIGSIVCAAARPSPRAAVALLVVTGRYVRWKDTLWLEHVDDRYLVATPESEKSASNTLARWIQAMGVYVRADPSRLPFRERVSTALATYFVEFGKTPRGDEGRDVVRRAAAQCHAYYERVSQY